jgi:uncharacterized membrane protein
VLDYEPPGGRAGGVGAAIAWIFGESPDQKIRESLERLKTILEAPNAADAAAV